jgi:hypothetical protein
MSRVLQCSSSSVHRQTTRPGELPPSHVHCSPLIPRQVTRPPITLYRSLSTFTDKD